MVKEFILARKNTFSRILAAAIVEVLPGAQIAQAGLVFHGFYCDFFFPHPMSDGLLIRLEEQIRQIIREKREVRLLEMVPFSAVEMLKSLGQKKRAAQVSQQEGLVRLMRLGTFADWCEEESVLPSTSEAGVFRLLDKIDLEKGFYRIFGLSAGSKKELKELSSNWNQFENRDHERVGCDQDFWKSEGGSRLWLPRGFRIRKSLVSFWREALAPIAEEVEGGEECCELLAEKVPSSMELVRISGEREERGLLDQPFPLALIVKHFLDLNAFSTSFLQIIHKSLTILGFAYRIRYSGKKRKGCPMRRALEELGWDVEESGGEADPKLEFLVGDALQCEWAAAEIGELKLKKVRGLAATVWVERNLALLIEKNDGSFLFGEERLNMLLRTRAGELIENK